MTENNVWFITGAGRGMGVDIARAALAAGCEVVATARDAAKAAAAVGEDENLLTVPLDITDTDSVDAAVRAAMDRFGRIDVLVNNAGNFQPGFFEEVSPEQFRAQIETNFFGPLNVTRAVLPMMRAQRSGHIITITSTAGIVSGGFGSAYGASKFALEGWTESLREEVEQFGIHVTAVEPGFFRTELLVEGSSTIWPDLSIDDYAVETSKTVAEWKSMNGQQSGDPAKLAANLVKVVELDPAPARWAAGADAVEAITQKGKTLIDQAKAHLDLSTGLDH
ncbi:SDR family oxidoreductase [Leifsonia poae]|uniref:Short-chain dehydrogenase/reductase n=1 Tax=Leifsonia poae TaxID=110933 RepID=A0A9W6H9U9_9MICO|nr:SDR family oxidoreductase [Leifsonia poae]GLJ76581.1 short-chain dehydrogenase/reductase [Leifsonia poae]